MDKKKITRYIMMVFGLVLCFGPLVQNVEADPKHKHCKHAKKTWDKYEYEWDDEYEYEYEYEYEEKENGGYKEKVVYKSKGGCAKGKKTMRGHGHGKHGRGPKCKHRDCRKHHPSKVVVIEKEVPVYRERPSTEVSISVPIGSVVITIGGTIYYYHQGRYYQQVGQNYVVVEQSRGAFHLSGRI